MTYCMQVYAEWNNKDTRQECIIINLSAILYVCNPEESKYRIPNAAHRNGESFTARRSVRRPNSFQSKSIEATQKSSARFAQQHTSHVHHTSYTKRDHHIDIYIVNTRGVNCSTLKTEAETWTRIGYIANTYTQFSRCTNMELHGCITFMHRHRDFTVYFSYTAKSN